MCYHLSRSAFSAAQTGPQKRNWILLDSQLSVDLFCNPALATKSANVDQKLILSTYAEELSTNTKPMVPGYGPVWFHEKAMTNEFSLAAIEEKI